ncbi:MAG: NlpC/P60 family protein [Phocaeicola sp.]|uniref:C40 family peptidase n=1 Tax=Phocaeicola sp. TaxID=2773926 RepID=UPI003FA0C770
MKVKNTLIILFMLFALQARAQELNNKTYGVVNISVCNLRVTPDFDAEMSTQALLGTPVHVLNLDKWYQIQTPDTYTGWVHPKGIYRMTKEEYSAWNKAEKVVITALFGIVYDRPSDKGETVSDVTGGDRLKFLGKKKHFYKVAYPDGRIGYVAEKIAKIETKWRSQVKQDASSIIKTAESMMGFPYIWAGMSPKGFDCSGFVRTILFLHDIIIPRDASQMACTGQHVDIASDFSNLQSGDLVFFGKKATADKKEHVSHVGIYIGNNRFIHSMGDVHLSSFDPNDMYYDSYNLNRLLYAVRFLHLINKDAAYTTTKTNSYYNE